MSTFTAEVYGEIRSGAQRSAAAATPLFIDIFRPTRVVDVGCGEGWWAREFARAGCSVVAIDATVPTPYEADGVSFRPADLREPVDSIGRHDLGLCLEVAEHLPQEAAETLIESLCRSAPTILFSAAVPGQGGHGHLNERWPGYWVALFERFGYEVSGAIRWLLWQDAEIEPWYRQNLLAASCEPNRWPRVFNTDSAAPHSVVIPELYERRTAESQHSQRTELRRETKLQRLRDLVWQTTGLYVSRVPR